MRIELSLSEPTSLEKLIPRGSVAANIEIHYRGIRQETEKASSVNLKFFDTPNGPIRALRFNEKEGYPSTILFPIERFILIHKNCAIMSYDRKLRKDDKIFIVYTQQ